jgi:CRISPR-associated protein Cas2
MRQAYIVTYDISHPKRLRKVYETMCGYGQWLQLSVFRCELSDRERVELRHELNIIINHSADQVLFIDIGSAHGGAGTAISSLGRPFVKDNSGPTVV